MGACVTIGTACCFLCVCSGVYVCVWVHVNECECVCVSTKPSALLRATVSGMECLLGVCLSLSLSAANAV